MTITDRLLDQGHLDPNSVFEVEDRTFYAGQRVMARRNNRQVPCGADGDFVRNGDRFVVRGPTIVGGVQVVADDTGELISLPGE